MPAYADADGKVVVYFKNSAKFNYRYSQLGFEEAAHLDDGDIGPFVITEEAGVAAGIRRVEALTGQGAVDHIQAQIDTLARTLSALNASTVGWFCGPV